MEELKEYKIQFKKECEQLTFYCKCFDELIFQIELFREITNKGIEAIFDVSKSVSDHLKEFNDELKPLENEPSGICLYVKEPIKSLNIILTGCKNNLENCNNIFEEKIPSLISEINSLKKNLMKDGIYYLKKSKENSTYRVILQNTIKEMFKLVIKNVFKGLVYLHQFFFFYFLKIEMNYFFQ